MSRKYPNNEEYEYNDFDHEDSVGRIKSINNESPQQRKKRWEREIEFDQNHDYEERR